MNVFQEETEQVTNVKIESRDFVPEKYIRKGFIRKVYGILFAQLAISFIFITLGTKIFSKTIQTYILKYNIISFIVLIVSIIVLILLCQKNIARIVPLNYILLGIFTLCQSYELLVISALSDPQNVFIALALTVACTLGLSIYAWLTKRDFSLLNGWLCSQITLLGISGLFCLFYDPYIVLYCGSAIELYSIYLIYDTQLILGKFGRKYESEDYIFAAISIYSDIIEIFVNILKLLNISRN